MNNIEKYERSIHNYIFLSIRIVSVIYFLYIISFFLCSLFVYHLHICSQRLYVSESICYLLPSLQSYKTTFINCCTSPFSFAFLFFLLSLSFLLMYIQTYERTKMIMMTWTLSIDCDLQENKKVYSILCLDSLHTV